MLKVFVVKGIYCPALCCDHCGEQIGEPSAAGYFYDIDDNLDPINPALILHKKCADIVEANRGKRFQHWDEFKYLLTRLPVNNAKPIDQWDPLNDYDE